MVKTDVKINIENVPITIYKYIHLYIIEIVFNTKCLSRYFEAHAV